MANGLVEERLSAARAELPRIAADLDCPIDAVSVKATTSERLGFTEVSSFSRWFSGEYGIPPSRWTPPEGAPPAVTGMDVAHFRHGRIHSLYVFLDPATA